MKIALPDPLNPDLFVGINEADVLNKIKVIEEIRALTKKYDLRAYSEVRRNLTCTQAND